MISELQQIEVPTQPTLFMGIGAPGSGKSTFLKNLKKNLILHELMVMKFENGFYETFIIMSSIKIYGK